MTLKPNPVRATLSTDRLKAFSDAVFAIVLTLPVIALEAPEGSHDSLGSYLLALEPQLQPYVGTFIMVSTFWISQYVIMQYVQKCNRLFIWLNVLLFLPVSLSPFITSQRAANPGDPVYSSLAGTSQVASLLILLLIWYYAAYRLRPQPPPRATVRSLIYRIFGAIGFCIGAAAVAPISERISTLFFLGVPLLFMRHATLDAGVTHDEKEQA